MLVAGPGGVQVGVIYRERNNGDIENGSYYVLGVFCLVWLKVFLAKRGGTSASPCELSRVTKIVRGYRKTVMLLLPYLISNRFGTSVTQGHHHKWYFVLGDYAID